MKPNHHWSVHVPDQLDDFGPVHNFWAFLTERLNKILKDLNSNNWTGGELEVSMMREFHRNAALDSKVCFPEAESEFARSSIQLYQILADSESDRESKFVEMLVGASANTEALGAVQDAAHTGELFGNDISFILKCNCA